jgi:hypothetical protein
LANGICDEGTTMTLKNILDETYEQLHRHRLVSTQYEFSRKWLKRSDGYYAYLRSTGAETTGDVALALWAECRKQKRQWLKATKRHQNNELIRVFFKGMAEKTEQLEQNVSEAVMERYSNS